MEDACRRSLEGRAVGIGEAPPGTQGRVLREALAAHAGETLPTTTERVVSAESDAGTRAHLSLSTVAGTSYLNRAWVE